MPVPVVTFARRKTANKEMHLLRHCFSLGSMMAWSAAAELRPSEELLAYLDDLYVITSSARAKPALDVVVFGYCGRLRRRGTSPRPATSAGGKGAQLVVSSQGHAAHGCVCTRIGRLEWSPRDRRPRLEHPGDSRRLGRSKASKAGPKVASPTLATRERSRRRSRQGPCPSKPSLHGLQPVGKSQAGRLQHGPRAIRATRPSPPT